MRRKLLPLLTVLALLLVAAGGAAAVADADTNSDSSPNESDDGDVGICLVGVDSPCNGDSADDTTDDERTADDGAEDDRMRIPEDRDGDGEIDDRFRGDDEDADAGICLVGVDSPCNSDSADDTTDERPASDGTTGDSQKSLSEGHDRNGDVVDRFKALLGLFVDLSLPFGGV